MARPVAEPRVKPVVARRAWAARQLAGLQRVRVPVQSRVRQGAVPLDPITGWLEDNAKGEVHRRNASNVRERGHEHQAS